MKVTGKLLIAMSCSPSLNQKEDQMRILSLEKKEVKHLNHFSFISFILPSFIIQRAQFSF